MAGVFKIGVRNGGWTGGGRRPSWAPAPTPRRFGGWPSGHQGGFWTKRSQKVHKRSSIVPFFKGLRFSGFHDLLFSALRTGQFDRSDAARHTAIGAAGALHIFVFLVGAAGLRSAQGALLRPPPLHEFCVFRAALSRLRENIRNNRYTAQKERGIVDEGGKCLPRHQGGQQAEHQLSDKQSPAELVGAVSTVHEARAIAQQSL